MSLSGRQDGRFGRPARLRLLAQVQLFLDFFSTPPSAKLKAIYRGRLDRLEAGLAKSADDATEHFKAKLREQNYLGERFRIRTEFIFRSTPPPGWEVQSDRSAPPPELRPSATRLLSSGPALRFYLGAIADAQIRFRQGARPDNPWALRSESPTESSWIDVFASPAVTTGPDTKYRITARVKKERQLQRALRRLADAGLVDLPQVNGKTRYDDFTLLREIGALSEVDPLDYRVPRAGEPCVTLPATFITNGWLHVLEDSEIAVLLMVACGRKRLSDEMVAIPGDLRLLHYGLSRDAYEAHRLLDWLGLLRVVADENRFLDRTKVEGYKSAEDARLHRMEVLDEGFEADAVDKLRKQLEHQLSR